MAPWIPDSLDKLSSFGAWAPILSSTWLIYYLFSIVESQGLILYCWVSLPWIFSFTSLSRYCPHSLCCQLKSPTPVHAGGPCCRPVCLIDFWMVPPRISQVPQVQFLLNWIHPHLCQTYSLILCSWSRWLALLYIQPLGWARNLGPTWIMYK